MDITVKHVQGEEREGFYVQPLIKRMWAVQLDILNIINVICRRHNIKYYGWHGTLLGAIRHHGFIPWDDDIDLAMLREDYEKFQHFSESELPEGWKILKVAPTLIRVINTDTINLNQDFLDKSHGCPFVLGIDIFCWDYIPQNKEEEILWVNMFWAAANLYVHWDQFKNDEQWQSSKWKQLEDLEVLTRYYFDRQQNIKNQLYDLADKIAAMYWDSGSPEVTKVSSLHFSDNYRIPRSSFDKIIQVPFEDTLIPIVEDYDLPCKLSYGDNYMTPKILPGHNDIQAQINILRHHFEDQGKSLPECFNLKS